MLKSIRTSLVALCFMVPVAAEAAALLTVLDQFEKKGLQVAGDVFAKAGVRGEAADQTLRSLTNSLKALSGGEIPNGLALNKIFSSNPELAKIFASDTEKITSAQIVKAINESALASKGRALGDSIAVCSQCVHESLRKLGVNYVSTAATKALKEILENPLDPIELRKQTVRLAGSFKITSFGAIPGDNVAIQLSSISTADPELAVRIHGFLKICADGSKKPRQSACTQMISLMKDSNGAVDFTESRFFMMAFEDMADEEFTAMAKELQTINGANKGASAKVKREAFEKWVDGQLAKGNTSADEIKRLKAQLCRCGYLTCA